ncbi:hypothetical protein M378DRAFT_163208 [Amanita muscaria Koide BX008]|uniref:Uncharacterized protein n=1 Tax=Amanita muscaria (strain Koide BX008) TaxID=946122 RepID=A0A0C2X6S3_AMAMK|nr:hypothetical protein M378DRAFT_163208 [Amanita muscaria Koide BX008]
MSTTLALHSPSRIVGTPFATTSTRFEYPFPDCSTSSSSPPISNSPASSPGSCASTHSSCTSASSSSSHCSFGTVSLSFSLPLSLPPSAQFHRSITLVSSPCTSPTGTPGQHDHPHNPPYHHTHHNRSHPKLRLQNPPPIPPTLIIKRNRWNLAYLGLKKDTVASSLSSSQDDPVISSSINASLPASERQSDSLWQKSHS